MNRLLTPIDKSIVVLLERLVGVALFLEDDCSCALGTTLRVEVELDRGKLANS